METYGNSDVARATGLTPIQICHLSEKGVVTPSVDTNGRGIRRKYTTECVVNFMIAKQLLKTGMSYRQIKKILDTGKYNSAGHFVFSDGPVTIKINMMEISNIFLGVERNGGKNEKN